MGGEPCAEDVVALSEREAQTLDMLARGLIDKEAARRMGVGLGTLRVYRGRLQAKLGTRGAVQTVLVAAGLGILDLDAIAEEAMAVAEERRSRTLASRRVAGATGSRGATNESLRARLDPEEAAVGTESIGASPGSRKKPGSSPP